MNFPRPFIRKTLGSRRDGMRQCLAAAACSIVATVSAISTATAAEPCYRLREATASHVGRTSATSSYPLKLSYARLPEKYRAQLRADYENMPATDEPPYPQRGVIDLLHGYTVVQRAARLTGRFRAAVRVDEAGVAQSIAIYETPDPMANNALAAAVMAPSYKPGRCSGQPCSMDFPVDISFELR